MVTVVDETQFSINKTLSLYILFIYTIKSIVYLSLIVSMSLLSLIRSEKLKQMSSISTVSDVGDDSAISTAFTTTSNTNTVALVLPVSEPSIPSSVLLSSDLRDPSRYKVGTVNDIFYIPNMVSDAMSAYLLHQIDRYPWTSVRQRSLMSFDSFDDWLQILCDNFTRTGVFGEIEPNHGN